MNRACQAIERTLAQGEPPADEMASLQKLLENEDGLPCLLASTRGERALLHKVFEAVERGELPVENLERRPGSEASENQLKSALIRSVAYGYTRGPCSFSVSDEPPRRGGPAAHARTSRTGESIRAGGCATYRKTPSSRATLLPAMSKMGEAFRRKHAILRCTAVALAAERYRQEKRQWPDSVEQLCPHYLAAVPLDPFDGVPLRYLRIRDGLVIYCVGPDAVDNGGNLNRQNPTLKGTDLGVRLWGPGPTSSAAPTQAGRWRKK